MSKTGPVWLEDAVLIYGPRKGGTTLYQNLLDGTPGLAAYPVEMKIKIFCRQPLSTPIPVKSYLDRSRLKDLKRDGFSQSRYMAAWAPVEGDALPLKALITRDLAAMIEARPQMAEARCWSAKEVGGHTRRIIAAWRAMFPKGKVLSIVRTPLMVTRAVLNDRRRKGQRLPFWGIMRQTIDPMRVVNVQLSLAGDPDIMTVSYEELVRDTEPVMRAVARFVGLPFDSIMLKPTMLGTSTVVSTASRQSKDVFRDDAKWTDGLTLREKIIVSLTYGLFNLLPGFRVSPDRCQSISAR